jgi:hypothetical protein
LAALSALISDPQLLQQSQVFAHGHEGRAQPLQPPPVFPALRLVFQKQSRSTPAARFLGGFNAKPPSRRGAKNGMFSLAASRLCAFVLQPTRGRTLNFSNLCPFPWRYVSQLL